ncbi:MAG: hypothetical protein IKB70_12390 [Bacilli bacterium]|nr:hypothetical protein [Bacilli bacterium]
MATLESLKPFSGEHSIKEAVVTFFLATKIIDPLSYKSLIETKFKEKFQSFNPIRQVQVIFANPHKPEPETRMIEDNGFKFTSFKDGKIQNVIQGLNEANRYFFSFHSLIYSNWIEFRSFVIQCAKDIEEVQGGQYVVAYSLGYTDEFTWDEADYDANLLFAKDGQVPDEFFTSRQFDYNLNAENKDKKQCFDRISVRVSNQMNQKFISINHNITFVIDEKPIRLNELIANSSFCENLEFAHDANKSRLKGILSQEVCTKIRL